ncbi:MAG: heat shock protein HtpX [Patescibacteria group bacterium]|nr:heat shock protein HtpX [Patescibacteria group bacterium]
MYSQIAANKRKTVYLIIFFLLFVGLLSVIFSLFVAGNTSITLYVLAGGLVYAIIAYFVSSKAALALNRAKPIVKKDNPRLYRIVENLSITDGLPMPQVYVIDEPAPNAFATGRDPRHASVAVTSGLLDIMTDTELEGVLAHELGHVKNYDIRVAMIVFGLVAAISLLADILLRMTWFRDDDNNNSGVILLIGIVAAILAPIIAIMIQLAVSRKREYLADATGALTTRYPEGLASALEKIAQTGSAVKHQNASTAHLYFANPLKGKSITNLFSTHPPIQDRVARLRQMETKQ